MKVYERGRVKTKQKNGQHDTPLLAGKFLLWMKENSQSYLEESKAEKDLTEELSARVESSRGDTESSKSNREWRRRLWGGKKPACWGGEDHRTGTCYTQEAWRPAKALKGNHRYMSSESYVLLLPELREMTPSGIQELVLQVPSECWLLSNSQQSS